MPNTPQRDPSLVAEMLRLSDPVFLAKLAADCVSDAAQILDGKREFRMQLSAVLLAASQRIRLLELKASLADDNIPIEGMAKGNGDEPTAEEREREARPEYEAELREASRG